MQTEYLGIIVCGIMLQNGSKIQAIEQIIISQKFFPERLLCVECIEVRFSKRTFEAIPKLQKLKKNGCWRLPAPAVDVPAEPMKPISSNDQKPVLSSRTC